MNVVRYADEHERTVPTDQTRRRYRGGHRRIVPPRGSDSDDVTGIRYRGGVHGRFDVRPHRFAGYRVTGRRRAVRRWATPGSALDVGVYVRPFVLLSSGRGVGRAVQLPVRDIVSLETLDRNLACAAAFTGRDGYAFEGRTVSCVSERRSKASPDPLSKRWISSGTISMVAESPCSI